MPPLFQRVERHSWKNTCPNGDRRVLKLRDRRSSERPRGWIEIDYFNLIFMRLLSLEIREYFPFQGGSKNPFGAPVTVKSDIPQFPLIVLEELAAFGNEQLFLFGTTSFVLQLSKTAITRQKVNVSGVEDLAIGSPEFFRGVREATEGPSDTLIHSPNLTRISVVGIGNEDMEVFLFSHQFAGLRD
jgi:hypothetical protein